MTENQMILMGWKDIGEACGVKDTRTIKRKAKKYKMPLIYIDGKPSITKENLLKWHARLHH